MGKMSVLTGMLLLSNELAMGQTQERLESLNSATL